jgi:DNA-binding CsgD family transcriptional regulator
MEFWDRLLTLFELMRGPRRARRHYYELDETLQSALLERAGQEQRPAAQIQAELLAAGLAGLHSSDLLKQRWESLSAREKQVTALTCLDYTNRQMAAYLGVSPDTIKGYVHQALVKWNAHSKDELRLLLEQWDFSDWAPRAQE